MCNEEALLGILSDCHGNTGWTVCALARMKSAGVTRVLSVGDFGFWDATVAGARFLDTVNEALEHHGMSLGFVGGYHEDHELLAKLRSDGTGHAVVRSRIRHLRAGSSFTLGTKMWLVTTEEPQDCANADVVLVRGCGLTGAHSAVRERLDAIMGLAAPSLLIYGHHGGRTDSQQGETLILGLGTDALLVGQETLAVRAH